MGKTLYVKYLYAVGNIGIKNNLTVLCMSYGFLPAILLNLHFHHLLQAGEGKYNGHWHGVLKGNVMCLF